MLRRENHVADPGIRGGRGPGSGIVEVRVEVADVALVVAQGRLLPAHHPLVASRQGVQTPVDEHPETGLEEPPQVPTARAANHGHPFKRTVSETLSRTVLSA